MDDERIKTVLMSALHVIAEDQQQDDTRKERLSALIERLGDDVRNYLGMDKAEFRKVLAISLTDRDHNYPFGKDEPYDNDSIDARDF